MATSSKVKIAALIYPGPAAIREGGKRCLIVIPLLCTTTDCIQTGRSLVKPEDGGLRSWSERVVGRVERRKKVALSQNLAVLLSRLRWPFFDAAAYIRQWEGQLQVANKGRQPRRRLKSALFETRARSCTTT